MVETWNDYEEGTAIEPGIAKCGSGSREVPLKYSGAPSAESQDKPKGEE